MNVQIGGPIGEAIWYLTFLKQCLYIQTYSNYTVECFITNKLGCVLIQYEFPISTDNTISTCSHKAEPYVRQHSYANIYAMQ